MFSYGVCSTTLQITLRLLTWMWIISSWKHGSPGSSYSTTFPSSLIIILSYDWLPNYIFACFRNYVDRYESVIITRYPPVFPDLLWFPSSSYLMVPLPSRPFLWCQYHPDLNSSQEFQQPTMSWWPQSYLLPQAFTKEPRWRSPAHARAHSPVFINRDIPIFIKF